MERNIYKIGKELFITSNEEIKEGDWFISLYSNSIQRELKLDWTLNKDAYKKIILTTDQDLIKNGVQAIDDEFLEWFVKNPSCEEVETVFNNRGISGAEKILKSFGEYEIKEPKPHSFCETPEEKCTMNYCDENGCQNRKRELVEPKQETLEEAAERLYPTDYGEKSKNIINIIKLDAFVSGAKWQQERSYSEEEVLEIIRQYAFEEHLITSSKPDIWFEQFKKK